jgi:hypothetical protein
MPLHAERLFVPLRRRLYVAHAEHEVVDRLHFHRLPSTAASA